MLLVFRNSPCTHHGQCLCDPFRFFVQACYEITLTNLLQQRQKALDVEIKDGETVASAPEISSSRATKI